MDQEQRLTSLVAPLVHGETEAADVDLVLPVGRNGTWVLARRHGAQRTAPWKSAARTGLASRSVNGRGCGVLVGVAAMLPIAAASCGDDGQAAGTLPPIVTDVDDHHDLHHDHHGAGVLHRQARRHARQDRQGLPGASRRPAGAERHHQPDDIQAGQELQIPTGAVVYNTLPTPDDDTGRPRRIWAMSFWPTQDHWSVQIPLHTPHRRLQALAETGFVALADLDFDVPSDEWLALEYMDWKSGGDTNFAPLASADGELDCRGFWDKGKTDKDALWTSNAALSPTLRAYVDERRRQLRPGSGDQARAADP